MTAQEYLIGLDEAKDQKEYYTIVKKFWNCKHKTSRLPMHLFRKMPNGNNKKLTYSKVACAICRKIGEEKLEGIKDEPRD